MLEQRPQRQIHLQLAADPGDQPGSRQRMAVPIIGPDRDFSATGKQVGKLLLLAIFVAVLVLLLRPS